MFAKLRRWPVISSAVFCVLLVFAVFAPLLAPHDPTLGALERRNSPPAWYGEGSAEYFLGTDRLGLDILSRVIFGARISVIVVAIVISAERLAALQSAFLPGYFGGTQTS